MTNMIRVRVKKLGFRSFKVGIELEVTRDIYMEYQSCFNIISNSSPAPIPVDGADTNINTAATATTATAKQKISKPKKSN